MAPSWWHPEEIARKRPYLETRRAVHSAVRAYFQAEGFITVETPALQASPGLERHIRPLAVPLRNRRGEAAPRYLHTSPEFAMKKLLAGGLPKIVQLCKVWRDGEEGPLHQPEFTMLEWYRANEGYGALIEDCARLLAAAGKAAHRAQESDGVLRWQGRTCDPAKTPKMLTVQNAFRDFAGIDLLATVSDADALAPDPRPLREKALSTGIRCGADDTWEDIFFHVMLERVEPQLGMGTATVLCEYPANLAALARRKPSDPRVAERFELYACGVELANAYTELTDPAEQRARFLHDRALHQMLYESAPPIDDDLLAALDHMPPAAGIALGFDRLVMLAANARHITDIMWAPVA
ncbi:MAG: EF-P lysine aminoacylase GenX [Rhodospirillaceae bacterium]|nr:EF-P lysine aminoacylase GenX [Rhodospirillaceae bacterium]